MARSHSLAPSFAPTLPLPGSRSLGLGLHVLLPAGAATAAGLLLAQGAGLAPEAAGTTLLACGAAFAYLHDRLAPGRRRLDRAAQPRRELALRGAQGALLALAAAAAFLGLVAFLLASSEARLAAAALGGVALGYPALARLPLGKTLAVAACWTAGAAWLPTGGRIEAVLRPEAGALFLVVAAACALCDLKDREGDGRAGVRSLPVLVGPGRARTLACLAAAGGAAWAAAAGSWALAGAGTGLLALAARPAWLEREILGPSLVDGWLLVAFASTLLL